MYFLRPSHIAVRPAFSSRHRQVSPNNTVRIWSVKSASRSILPKPSAGIVRTFTSITIFSTLSIPRSELFNCAAEAIASEGPVNTAIHTAAATNTTAAAA